MYIRTKDGAIYDLENDDIAKIDGKYKECYVQKDTGDTCFKDIEILKQSENLEELCDGFYIDFVNYKGFDRDRIGEPYTFEEFRDCFMAYREYEGNQYTHCEGYGFIKTFKGLIYVAKLNDKGELCLL